MITYHARMPKFLLLLVLVSAQTQAADPQLRVLLLSGKNNHDWHRTTPVIRQVLEESGRYQVHVLEHPSTITDQMLRDVDVIVSNWTSFPSHDRSWGPVAESAVLGFVRAGKGIVMVHAAGSAFPEWTEFQQLIGATWGAGTGHGPYHRFHVTVADTVHPVTRVISDFTTTDELWHRMQRNGDIHPLCLAYSDTAGGGSGNAEPVAFTTQFGEGRGFYLVLGHDERAMAHPAWKMLLLRGAEWAATGKATIEAPFDLRQALMHAAAGPQAEQRERMAAVAQLVQSSSRNPALRRALAQSMAEMLRIEVAVSWKKFLCEQIGLIGTSEDVPALTDAMRDTQLRFSARAALERIPGPASTDALRSDTPDTVRPLKSEALLRRAEAYEIGGALSEAGAIYASLLSPKESAQVRSAGFTGLLRCHPERRSSLVRDAMRGGDDARLAALLTLLREPAGAPLSGMVAADLWNVPSPRRGQFYYALADIGERRALPDMYAALFRRSPDLQRAALYGIGRLGDSSSVLRISTVMDNEAALRPDAAKSLGILPGAGVSRRLVALLSGRSSPTVKQEICAVLAARGDTDAAPTLLHAARTGTPEVVRAAIKAVGVLGGTASSADLVQMLCEEHFAAQRPLLVTALVRVARRDTTADGVSETVLRTLAGSPAAAKPSLLQVLGELGGPKASAAVTPFLKDPDPAVQAAAIRALSSWPDGTPIVQLLAFSHAAESAGLRLMALRGAVGLLDRARALSDSARLALIDDELQRAEPGEPRSLWMSVLGKERHVRALALASSYLVKPGSTDEAALAIAGIARSLGTDQPAETRRALKKALRCRPSAAVTQQLQPLLDELESPGSEHRITVAVITGGHEFDEQAFLGLFTALQGAAVTHLPQADQSEFLEEITDWPYDVIVLYNMTQKISDRRRENLLQLLDRGVGLLSLHHASGAFQEWGEFQKIIGCRYLLSPVELNGRRLGASTYLHDVEIPVVLADSAHPVTHGVLPFTVRDETYHGCVFEPDDHILLTTSEPSSDTPLGWARTYRRSHVVHLQLGHGPAIFGHDQFRRLVAQAIRWCAAPLPEKVSQKGATPERSGQ